MASVKCSSEQEHRCVAVYFAESGNYLDVDRSCRWSQAQHVTIRGTQIVETGQVTWMSKNEY
jgi:hypothetical protein